MIYVFIATFLMSLRGIFRACKWRFLHSLWHPLFFFLALLPLKVMALVFCMCSDSKSKKDRWKILVPIYVWMFVALGVFVGKGIIYNIVVEGERLNNWMQAALFAMCIVLGMLWIHWLSWGLGIFVPENEGKLKQMYGIENDK